METKIETPIAIFTTSQGVKLRTLFETLTPLLVEGNLVFNASGIRINGSSKIAFADISIPKGCDSSLSNYQYDYESPEISVGISFEGISSSLSATGPHDSVSIIVLRSDLKHQERPNISLRIFNNELGYSYNFQLYLLLLETTKFNAPKETFSKCISLPSSQLQKTLRCAMKRGTFVQFYTRFIKDQNYLFISTDGNEARMTHAQIFNDNGNRSNCDKYDLYSLKYLLLIGKATNLSNCVQIFLRSDLPIFLKYRVGTIGTATFALAPIEKKSKVCHIPNQLFGKEIKSVRQSTFVYKRPVRRKRKNVSITK